MLTLSIILLIGSIVMKQLTYTPVLIIMLILSLYSKVETIDKDGVTIKSGILIFGRKHNWNWNEVTAIIYNRETLDPNGKIVICKEKYVREIIIPAEDVDRLIRFAKAHNRNIYVAEIEKNAKSKDIKNEILKGCSMLQRYGTVNTVSRPPISELKIGTYPMKRLKQNQGRHCVQS